MKERTTFFSNSRPNNTDLTIKKGESLIQNYFWASNDIGSKGIDEPVREEGKEWKKVATCSSSRQKLSAGFEIRI